ncbi:hypothetical protein UlMin_033097 [Ulmus minor]
MSATQSHEPEQRWQWENATAGAIVGFATIAAMHPLNVVRTKFQAIYNGRVSTFPTHKNTAHAIFTFPRFEGLRGLFAGFSPAVLGYDRAKQRYSINREVKLSPSLHLTSSAEAGALVCFCTNHVCLVKTRLQLQNPLHQTRPYFGLYDAFRTIMREERWLVLYKGIVPSLFLQVSHGAIQFTAYKELYKLVNELKSGKNTANSKGSDKVLVIRARLQLDQHMSINSVPKKVTVIVINSLFEPALSGTPLVIQQIFTQYQACGNL